MKTQLNVRTRSIVIKAIIYVGMVAVVLGAYYATIVNA
jgi:hypothetical protein